MKPAAFGVRNPVPANLLMVALVLGGVLASLTITREFFPEIDPEAARIELVYPGATPREIEESLARKVEDAVASVDGIKRIETHISENAGVIFVKFNEGTDVEDRIEDVESEIERLTDLPEDAERIRVTKFEPNFPVIMVTLYGDIDEHVLKGGAQQIKDDLERLPGMGRVLTSGMREYEVRVEVDADKLVEFGVSNTRVAEVIRRAMVNLPSGAVRGVGGSVRVRTIGTTEDAAAIGDIVVKAMPSGETVRVQDVAKVRDGFADEVFESWFNGKAGASVAIFKSGDQDAISMAQMVKAYVAGREKKPFAGPDWERLAETPQHQAWQLGFDSPAPLPSAVLLHTDLARFIEGRLDLLSRNALQGAVLVFLALLLVLNLRTAWWVMVGLFTAVCGTLLMMNLLGVTLNLLTMFGLLVTLGMLTDDAIVVAENIVAKFQNGDAPRDAAIRGGSQVFWPVVGTVTTTIVAFAPLAYIEGNIGKMLGALPWVVFCALSISLIESMVILPSHMVTALRGMASQSGGVVFRWADRFSDWRDQSIVIPLTNVYGRVAAKSVEFRWIAASIAVSILIVSFGMVAGERVPFVFLPADDTENIIVRIRMPVGTSADRTRSFVAKIEHAARAQPEVKFTGLTIGSEFDFEMGVMNPTSTSEAQLAFELTPVEERDRSSPEILDAVRSGSGDLSEAELVAFEEVDGGPAGPDITFEVRGSDAESVDLAVEEIKAVLGEYNGVYGIYDSDVAAQRELKVTLLPGATSLGFTVGDVAQQVRGAILGIEAHVFSDRREDISVRVSLDEDNRRKLSSIEDMWVISPMGRGVPLREIASISEGDSLAVVRRINRTRAVVVTADTESTVSPESITADIGARIDEIREAHPNVIITSGGRQQDLYDALRTLPYAAGAAALMIYVVLAWLFASYIQPIAVMLAIPFGAIGVVWGHFLLGFELTFLSLIGFVALAGIVVNNSLILVEFFNRNCQEGMEMKPALVDAGRRRLRPIILTTATTILGLTPLMLEQSFQARFLIPMAISITCGLASSTVLTLLVLPAILVIVDDVVGAAHWLWFGRTRSPKSIGCEEDLSQLDSV